MKALTLSVILLSFVSFPAFAADTPDQKFAKEAAISSMAEIDLATLASEKASSDAVKQYAQHVMQDHEQATAKLKEIAAQKNIQLPTAMDSSHKKLRDKLAQKSGPEFDQEYIQAMVKDHKKTVKTYEKQAKSGKDADLKAYAGELTPTLRTHLEQAQQVEKQLKNKTSRS